MCERKGEGGREGGKEGGREGGKEGRREGGKEGKRGGLFSWPTLALRTCDGGQRAEAAYQSRKRREHEALKTQANAKRSLMCRKPGDYNRRYDAAVRRRTGDTGVMACTPCSGRSRPQQIAAD